LNVFAKKNLSVRKTLAWTFTPIEKMAIVKIRFEKQRQPQLKKEESA